MNNKNEPMQNPIKVRNKDIPILWNVLSLMQEVTKTEEMRQWQRDRLLNVTQHLSGMPGGGGMPKGLDEPFAKLSELEGIEKEQIDQYLCALDAAEKILNGIESHTMRTFVLMKYVMDVPNMKIMEELNMSKWRFEQARRCIEEAPNMAHAKWKERYEIQGHPSSPKNFSKTS